jgi:acyl-CoA synthetase (AMP-forming)/AMP-acid ligase II
VSGNITADAAQDCVLDVSDALAHDPVSALTAPWSGVSLVDLFASSCHLNAHATAFGEAPFSAIAPARRLTYLQANEAADRLAIALGGLALQPGATVAICLGATIEAPLALIGTLRAGFVPCLLPPTLSRSEAAHVLRSIAVDAVIAAGAVGPMRPAEVMRAAAVENGPRYILGFGARLPAGVVPLDETLMDAPEARVVRAEPLDPGRPLGLVTLERTRGSLALYRHDQESLVAAALGLVLRAGVGAGDRVLSTLSPMSLAGIVTGLVPVLLTGGALFGLGLFESATLMRMLGEDAAGAHLVVPSVLETPLREAGILGGTTVASTVIVHRPPARFDRAAAAGLLQSPIVDVLALGERGSLAARRGQDGRPTVALGEIRIPDDDGPLVISARAGEDGIVSVAGAAVSTRIHETFPDRETDWLATEVEVATDGEGQIVLATPTSGLGAGAARIV